MLVHRLERRLAASHVAVVERDTLPATFSEGGVVNVLLDLESGELYDYAEIYWTTSPAEDERKGNRLLKGPSPLFRHPDSSRGVGVYEQPDPAS